MCFAPQRHALFRHLNFQKWSEHGVFCTFWLRNVLRATTACTFSTLSCQKWSGPGASSSKCASHHDGVQFFISHLASRLRTRRFSEPTFRPSGATNHWKNTVNRDFPTFSRTWIFFLLLFFLLPFSLLLPGKQSGKKKQGTNESCINFCHWRNSGSFCVLGLCENIGSDCPVLPFFWPEQKHGFSER